MKVAKFEIEVADAYQPKEGEIPLELSPEELGHREFMLEGLKHLTQIANIMPEAVRHSLEVNPGCVHDSTPEQIAEDWLAQGLYAIGCQDRIKTPEGIELYLLPLHVIVTRLDGEWVAGIAQGLRPLAE